MKVQLKNGEVELRKPNAGQRNRALIKATHSNETNEIEFIIELLPLCIAGHPWGVSPVRQALEGLEVEEYDKLLLTMKDLLGVKDITKKSEDFSTDKEKQI